MTRIGAVFLMALAPLSLAEQRNFGLWLASDESDTSQRSVVALELNGDELIGRIERVINAQGEEIEAICRGCPGDMKDKPMRGLVFITGLRKAGTKWVGGQVANLAPGPLRGIVADCELEIRGPEVHFFGYLGLRILGRHVLWKAYKK